MSTSKKPLRKRKRQSPPPPSTSRLNRRFEKLRGGQRNLWSDDDDDENENEQSVQPKTTTSNKTYIVLTDSDDEKASSRRRSKKKSSRIRDESYPSDNDHKITSKCATCLICSILSTLTSYNCCSRHLSLLINNKNSHHNHEKLTTNTDQWPPQQVMIVPMTDELIQRYLNPQEINRLRTQSSISKKSIASNKSTRQLSKKSTITLEPSDTEHSNIPKSKSSKKSSHTEPDKSNSSSIIIDPILPNSQATPSDSTFTVITSTSSTINSFESPNTLDTCQLQQSSDQPIIIDDSQPDTQQENRQNDPWTPISDDTYAAMEIALDQIDQSSQDQTQFTPVTARRTPTDIMASRLPKIQLKKGRFRQGKPIAEKTIPDTTTNECCSSIISQSTSTSVIITNTRPPPSSLETIIEDESLIIQSTHQISEKSSHILSQRHENTSEGLSDTVMSCLFAQDESSQHDNIHTITKTISNHALPPPSIIIEDCSREIPLNKSLDNSQSSQLTNDQSDTQPLIPSATNDKKITPKRISYRLNPDGTRVSVSRPPLPTSLRRASTDLTPIISHTNK